MRQLTKIVFVNSATIRYQEIPIDGNVHLIGTQGVGKSTILRTILFFYNADTGKLGIPREKKSYPEYYFSYSNSYIIYEVERETGPFCVLTYKQAGRIAYRFIDAAYKADYFITDNNALEGWDKIRAKLDAAGVDYTRKIERYEEFRNILYGNNEGKSEFKKYALLDSKLYQNIPRTIQNVFLNSKLEAEFIKKTIIDSIMEESVSIDLGIYRHHLQEFENEYKDIETFKSKKTQEKAEKILLYHNNIIKALSIKKESYSYLSKAVANEEKKPPILKAKIEKLKTEYDKEQGKLKTLDDAHTTVLEKINKEKGVWEDNLKKAEEKSKHYRKINIDGIVARVNQETELKNKQSNLSQEQDTITTAFKDIDQKYKVRFEQLENEAREYKNTQNEKGILLKDAFTKAKEELQLSFEQGETVLRNQYKDLIDDAEAQLQEAQAEVSEFDKKLVEANAERFFEKEIEGIKAAIAIEEKIVSVNETKIKISEAEKEKLGQRLEHETGNIEREFSIALEKLNSRLKESENGLTKLTEWINSSSNSLFGFLNEKYPGWEHSIGKVCREDIIFNSDLTPELYQATELLYGVKLNLGDLETTVKTLEGYNKDKKELEAECAALKKEREQLESNKINDLEKLRKSLQPKVRKENDLCQQLKYEMDLASAKVVQLTLDREEMEAKAANEKKRVVALINQQLSEARAKFEVSKGHRTKLTIELDDKLKTKRTEKNELINTLQVKMQADLKQIEKQITDFMMEIEKRRNEINESKHKELQGKGLDTGRLKVIEKELREIKDELSYIDNNKKVVFEFQMDKEQLLDKIDEFTASIKLKDEEKERETQQYQKKKDTILQGIARLKREIDETEDNLKTIEKELKAYEDFKSSKDYEIIEELKKIPEGLQLESISSYIGKIKDAHYSYQEQIGYLITAVNDFAGKFTAANIFNFKTGFAEPGEYLSFAQTLKEFIDESKISEFEKRVNKRYAEIINFIDSQTADLISKEGDIQQVISKINQDFKSKNFVSAISLIEMKIEDSTNRIVDILKRIRNFNLDGEFNSWSSGPNLFSTDVDEKRIRDAISLLALLVKEIKESKTNYINVADSFELKFRVVENQNDSGWVEKLSNVGSEGTDILVKAMINIMLLNVFKETASRKFKSFKLHCMMDEIGRLHPGNVRGILKFANERNILLINGSPIEHDALAYKHIYELRKDAERNTRVKRLISVKNEAAVGNS